MILSPNDGSNFKIQEENPNAVSADFTDYFEEIHLAIRVIKANPNILKIVLVGHGLGTSKLSRIFVYSLPRWGYCNIIYFSSS